MGAPILLVGFGRWLTDKLRIGSIVATEGSAMMKQLLEILREYRFIDRAILFLRLFVGALITLHIIDKMQTYNFVLTGYPALLFGSSTATFVIFTPSAEKPSPALCSTGTAFSTDTVGITFATSFSLPAAVVSMCVAGIKSA